MDIMLRTLNEIMSMLVSKKKNFKSIKRRQCFNKRCIRLNRRAKNVMVDLDNNEVYMCDKCFDKYLKKIALQIKENPDIVDKIFPPEIASQIKFLHYAVLESLKNLREVN